MLCNKKSVNFYNQPIYEVKSESSDSSSGRENKEGHEAETKEGRKAEVEEERKTEAEEECEAEAKKGCEAESKKGREEEVCEYEEIRKNIAYSIPAAQI
ncbi:hypothetical protein Glove_393g33 [Diversispora epigaea]|uniref:Uncharacterized protein n=1 Tax=Diversispora epigaea TaxID=1348612 RepID=A0A397H608_9GLOM|nr:hypothetical protein Glove_393g33 [Diversispora epigaea]